MEVRHNECRLYVKTASLYGELDEEIYTKQSEGSDFGAKRVLRRKQSLYSLKQARVLGT
jgi:hypothetical protein